MGVKWTDEQQKAISSRNGSLLVSAAAGSGKTAVLVERLLRFVTDEGRDIDKFLMITFTSAAAGELRAKIIDALSKKVAENSENRHLAKQMTLVHRAQISTIHAFCMQVLREHGHYLNIPSDFKIIDEGEGDILRRQVLDDILEEKYEKGEKTFQQMCAFLAGGRDDKTMTETILKLHSKSRSHPSPEKWLDTCASMYECGSDVWEKEIIKYVSELCTYLAGRVDTVMAEIKNDAVLDAAYTAVFANDKQNLMSLTGEKTWEELYENSKKISFMNLSSTRKCEDPELRDWAKAERDKVKTKLSSLCTKYLCKSSEQIKKENEALSPVAYELCRVAGELNRRFTEVKLERGYMDYSDLEHFTIELLVKSYDEEKDLVEPTQLAKEISDDFCEIMVDEYQDTNCIQDIIFRAISKDEKNLTMVGDLKQSIYRFRLADPTIFLAKYKAYKDYDEAEEGEARVVNLSRNFRSRPQVLDTCNRYFKLTMTERLGELDYTEREYLNPGKEPADSDINCESELVVINLDDAESDGEAVEVRDAEARYVASCICELHEEGVPYEDIVILLRSQVNRTPIYEGALRQLGIPCVSEKKEGILGTTEVSVILSFLQIIDNPLWDIPLVSVLRSPLFAFTADDLAGVRRCKNGAFYHALNACAKGEGELSQKASDFIKLLSEFRNKANEIGADELIWQVIEKTGARGMFGAMSEGNVRISNLKEFYNYAVRFEGGEFRGLHAFLSHIAYLTERDGDIGGDNTENGSGAVKIMSIHKSKGLEFPIVFMVDGNRKFNERDLTDQVIVHPKYGLGLNFRDNELRYECASVARNCIALTLKNEIKSEELRVLYVAMTRAKDKLIVVCAEKNADRRLEIAKNTALDGKVPPLELLGASSLDMWYLLPQAVDPGIFNVKVVDYCDIPSYSEEVKKAENSESAKAWQVETLSERFGFEYPYKNAIDSEGKLTATGMSHEGITTQRHFRRPRFLQKHGLTASEKGIAIHLVMQFVDFDKCTDKESVEREIERLYNEEYITREQYEVIPKSKIYGFFNSELGELTRNNKCRREFNFSRLVRVSENDTALLQGVVDLIIEVGDELVIVDFKSDASINDNNLSQYKRQLAVYKESVEAIFEKRVRDCYLYFIQQEKIIKSEK